MILQLSLGCVIVYLLYALIHHLKDKTLTLEVIIEYILIACLVVVLLSNLNQ